MPDEKPGCAIRLPRLGNGSDPLARITLPLCPNTLGTCLNVHVVRRR